MKILELQEIYKSFGEKEVLKGLNLSLEKNEIISLLGVSGVGKSTVFNIISGTIKPDSGKVLLNGEDITGKKGKVSYMLQKDLLFPHFTILENVSLPLMLSKKDNKEKINISEMYFSDFGLEGTEDKYPSQLSGGMRQRAALLRTYLNKNEVLLLDEPFSALDMITKEKMHYWFLEIMKKYEMSGIFITHDVDEGIFLSDKVCILTASGKIDWVIEIDREKRDESFKLSEEFLEYKREIAKKLDKS